VFATIIVLIKRVFIGDIAFGRYLLTRIQNKNALKWVFADRLLKIMHRSPFAAWVSSLVLFRTIFYKGMGAGINSTLVMDKGSMIVEPWGLTAGNNVIIGFEASITGHKVENLVLTLGPVTIGHNTTIGARSIVMPNVEIGNNVIIGANSVVTSGTKIPDGETWVGNPAQKSQLTAIPPRQGTSSES
jgi:acetyltransferase-like isoleucine patch superfamily enzyme